MSQQMDSPGGETESAFPWILEHLMSYPGSYEIPLRTMYTLNATSQNQQPVSVPPSPRTPGNAFPRSNAQDELQSMSTATAAAQLRANLMTQISQLPSQPTSLPPAFITSFVRKCFTQQLELIDFPQALTALDYLKDLEGRRRREVLAALQKLGIEKDDITNREKLAKKYPGVLQWVNQTAEKEKSIEAQYSQVYVGLRRWTLVNEMSLTPFNKSNCLAMLNTLYPPLIAGSQFNPPTAQLTRQILQTQRQGFFRYVNEVEKVGKGVLSSLINQHKRPGDANGWPNLRETLDSYLRTANAMIDECNEVTSKTTSPTAASFSSSECDEEARRKVDSGISFGSSGSSDRNSGQSHATRPSTSSSISSHNRKTLKEKFLPEKPLPTPVEFDEQPYVKPAGSTLERIARELRKIKSKSNMRSESRSRPATAVVREDAPEATESSFTTSPPPKERTLSFKRSLRKMRSNGVLRETDANTRPSSQGETYDDKPEVPAFDVEEMSRRRKIWEAQESRRGSQ